MCKSGGFIFFGYIKLFSMKTEGFCEKGGKQSNGKGGKFPLLPALFDFVSTCKYALKFKDFLN